MDTKKSDEHLLPEGWVKEGTTLKKVFVFPDFKRSIEFVNRIAELAEREEHHPNIGIFYNKVILTLSTHEAGGLTERDYGMAGKIG
jgi:4a-hydroxytetrahydrobiopterin dehydratase